MPADPVVIQVLEFIFASFWRWLGTLLLVGAVAGALSSGVRIVRTRVER